MNYDHNAIFKAYPNQIKAIDDELGVFGKDGKPFTIDNSKVTAARTELDKLKYKSQRAAEYPSVVDQLDLIYHSGVDAWKTKIKETKDKYPK